jgi:hypothetical protein
MTMFAQIARLFKGYGFHRQPVAFNRYDDWHNDPFYTSAGEKAQRLAAIARQRDALKDELRKAVQQKKARAPIYAALRALSIEELNVEGRR